MYQQLQLSGASSGQPPRASGHGASGVIPYDRNLYLTVTSPDGQDKEIIGAKACCQHVVLASLEILSMLSLRNCIWA